MLGLRRGFTLIEIAIVLIVAGLMMAGALTGIRPVIENSRISQTNKKLDRIELALLAYVMQNGCLPCPANGALGSTDTSGNAGWSRSDLDYYGPGNTTTTAQNRPCAASVGASCNATTSTAVVPWQTLNLKDADTVDGWQDRISYKVTTSLTVTAGTSMVRTAPNTYPEGDLDVNNNSSATQTSEAAYVLISHGPDRAFAYVSANGTQITTGPNVGSTSQSANNPTGTGPYRQDLPRPTEGTGYFDDIVRYRTAASMIQDCGKNACGNPP